MPHVDRPAGTSGAPPPVIGPRSERSNAPGMVASPMPSSQNNTGRSWYQQPQHLQHRRAGGCLMSTPVEQHRVSPTSADPRIGVSILTYNRVDECSRTVERMLALPERPRIVVVDNGSKDGTPDVL